MDKIYLQKEASVPLRKMIKSFWSVNDQKKDINIEKIIPDGFPELIFHYGDPYKTNIEGTWQLQNRYLMAGQIRNHFYLENTGKRQVFGIKLQPWSLNMLFGINMSHFTDRVVQIPAEIQEWLGPVIEIGTGTLGFDDKIEGIESLLESKMSGLQLTISKGQRAAEIILETNGKSDLRKIRDQIGMSERSLERYFKSSIGLSPKYYSRIIRFSHIFKVIQGEQKDWADIFYITGFYDQSHFIKNFKEFTGEDPSRYGFSDENLANLFLKD